MYNTCTHGGVPNYVGWIEKIKPLISQTLDGVTICHSDNGSDDKSLNIVKNEFGMDMSYLGGHRLISRGGGRLEYF